MRLKKPLRMLVIIALLLALFGCSDRIEPGNVKPGSRNVVSTRVAVAKIMEQPFLYEAVGTVQALTASTISSKLMGTVQAVSVKEGDDVVRNDVLVVLDRRHVDAQLKQAEAALSEAKGMQNSARSAHDAAAAEATLARSTYNRYLNLMKDQSVSRQEFDEVQARYRKAEASMAQTGALIEAAGYRVKQAEAGLTAAGVSEKDAVIRAPFDGKVTAKMIDVGDLASSGKPLLTLEKKGEFCVDLVLPEQHFEQVTVGQQVALTIPSVDDRPIHGRIDRIVPAADQKSRSVLVKVALPKGVNALSGMFARVQIPLGDAGMLLLPSSAIVLKGQLTGFYLVDQENCCRFRLVRPGRKFGDWVEIVSGIQEGNRYIVSPPPGLVDGSIVEVPA